MKTLFAIALSLCFLLPAVSQAQSNGSGQRIVIMDSGMASNDFFRNRVFDQWCWSQSTVNNVSTNWSAGSNHYDRFSMCGNGGTKDFNSSNAAEVPLIVHHNSCPTCYKNHIFGSNHGSTVLGEAATTASGARFLVINNTYYDGINGRALNLIGQRVPCGVHGPTATADFIGGIQQPSGSVGCYEPNDAERQSEVIAKILSLSKIAAINYSATASANCNLNNSVFRTLKDRNIAFVSSAGNGGASAAIGYPACNSNVISVGVYDSINNRVHPVTSLTGAKLDFLADGTAPNNIGAATSFAAPVVSAAFAIVQSAETRVRTVDEIKFALEYTSPVCVPTPRGCVNVVTKTSAEEAAECIKMGTCRPNLPPGGDDGGVGVVDGGQYGSFYGDTDTTSYDVDLPFSTLAGESALSITAALPESEAIAQAISVGAPPEKRDVIVTFTATMTDSFSTRNGIEVFANNTRLFSTNLFNGEQEYTFVIPRGRFTRTSGNMVSLKPIYSTAQSPTRLWGLTNIDVQLSPIVDLTVGQTDTTRYGYSENPERPSGMRVSFPLQTVATDMVFTVTGWDIDRTNETEVFLNGKSQGFLNTTPNSAYGTPQTFLFRKADLGLGDNIIELVQRVPFLSGVSLEQWAVKNMQVQFARPDMVGEQLSLQDSILKPNKPFSVQAVVRNNGAGSSPETILRFYLSTDENITTGDTQLTSIPFAALNEQRTRAVLQQLQTSLVNSDRYIGFCLDVVAGEVATGNNCSAGVALKNATNVAPIIMLLLDD